MTPVKPILKPINKHLMETSDGADELCAVADLLEQAARKLRRWRLCDDVAVRPKLSQRAQRWRR